MSAPYRRAIAGDPDHYPASKCNQFAYNFIAKVTNLKYLTVSYPYASNKTQSLSTQNTKIPELLSFKSLSSFQSLPLQSAQLTAKEAKLIASAPVLANLTCLDLGLQSQFYYYLPPVAILLLPFILGCTNHTNKIDSVAVISK